MHDFFHFETRLVLSLRANCAFAPVACGLTFFFNFNFVQLSTVDYFLPKNVNCCTIKYCILCSGGRGFSERVLNSTEIYNYFAVLAKNI